MQRLASILIVCSIVHSAGFAHDWPQWRGPARDGRSLDTGLLATWPEDGPSLFWKATDIGEGYSSPSIVNGRVYLQTTRGDDEFAISIDEQSGAQLWSVAIGKVGANRGPQYPGTRSTPTFDDGRIYCLASAGELVCLDAASGDKRWQRHLKEDFDGQPGNWAYSESVLIDGNLLICTPGGDRATLVALDKSTGEVVWESHVPDAGSAEYASIEIAVAGGIRQYVQYVRKGLVGVAAETGQFLWRYDKTVDPGANIMTPVIDNGRVFSAGARTGGALLELVAEGDSAQAREVYFERKLSPSIGGAVLVDGYIYGTTRQGMFCADFATGDIQWTERGLGAASVCYADNRLYVRGHDSGEVALVEPSPQGYRERGRLTPAERSEAKAWPHPVVANGRLYLRDQGALLCYDVRSER